MSNPRLCAFDVLYAVSRDGAYSNLALDKLPDSLSQKDRAFATELVYGVTERRLTLEWLVSRFLKSKPKPKVKLLLLLGAYQLCFMDKVPASAAINETVALAPAVGCDYYKGLINAVLRQVDAQRVDIDALEDDSLRFSCPPHLIRMWEKMYGRERTLAFLETLNEKPPVYAVPNVLFVDADELQYELLDEGIPSEVTDGLVMITSPFDVRRSKAFRRGLFHIEDKSAYEAALALGAGDGDTVLDVCAAPGGKAFTVAERMHNTGRVVACDLYPQRASLIAEGAERLCIGNLTALVNDATVFNPSLPRANRILCDVPCSGFGIIRRKPEIRYKELDSIKELPALQYAILETAARYLTKGGRLVYATCTLNKRENEAVVTRFLEEHKDFTLRTMNTSFPDRNGGDGFFYAVMEQTDDGH